jgi:nickel superoxide dismutase
LTAADPGPALGFPFSSERSTHMTLRHIGILLAALFLAAISAPGARAHCEIPCGIYHDDLRIELIREHIETIEKSASSIAELSKANPVNYNQLVRWVQNKEDHANQLQEVVTQYFMTQRVKPADPKDAAATAAYVKQITLLHAMLVQAMKAKQTADLEPVEKLKALVGEFYEAYFGKAEKDHLGEHGR